MDEAAAARTGSTATPPAPEIPTITLQCSAALTADLDPDAQALRSKTVMQSAPRMPAVAFFGGQYGERWYVDIIALSHNAVRRQLFDAFTIANALGKVVHDVGDTDLARVYAWFGSLEAFVRVVFEVEDRFLYPLVDSHVKNARTADGTPVFLPELLSVRGRKEAKAQIMDLLCAARKTQDVATGEIPAKVSALRYALDQFGGNILDYFAAMEKFAPKLLKKALKNGPKEKNKIERKEFDFIRGQPRGEVFAALLTQCIERRARRKEFIERNIRKEKTRNEFRAHVKNVEASHMQLARSFDQVAAQYERRFNMHTFVKHYDANNDGKQTLEMFGDMDINYEATADENVPAVVANSNDVNEGDEGEILDDDVIEVAADGGEARELDAVDDLDDDDIIAIEVPISQPEGEHERPA